MDDCENFEDYSDDISSSDEETIDWDDVMDQELNELYKKMIELEKINFFESFMDNVNFEDFKTKTLELLDYNGSAI